MAARGAVEVLVKHEFWRDSRVYPTAYIAFERSSLAVWIGKRHAQVSGQLPSRERPKRVGRNGPELDDCKHIRAASDQARSLGGAAATRLAAFTGFEKLYGGLSIDDDPPQVEWTRVRRPTRG